MGDAIGQVLPLAVGVALSPLPIVAVVLMLGTPRARANGPAFVAGWILGLAVVGTLVLVAAGSAGATSGGGPANWVGIVELVLGVALLGLAVRQWRGRPKEGETPALPTWMRSLDGFTPTRSLAIAAALAGINPKNLLLTVAAAAAIAQTGASTGSEAAALAVFVLIATLGVGAPVALYFALGERAARRLESLKAWLASNDATIMAVLLLVIGAKLIGNGISILG
jgi:threonine/homoserine/homoserine lactone efflux protein